MNKKHLVLSLIAGVSIATTVVIELPQFNNNGTQTVLAKKKKAKKQKITKKSSLKDLQVTISSPVGKEEYQNLDSQLMDSAKNTNDIKNPGDQHSLKKLHVREKNILHLAKQAKKDYKHEKKFMTKSDKKTFKKYTNSLVDYLNALHDYAVSYQTNEPVIEDSDSSDDVIKDSKDELNEAQQTYNKAKNNWSSQYDAIMNRQQ